MKAYHYHHEKCIATPPGLAADALTFSVLSAILRGGTSHTITDHNTFCIAFSTSPYPVWIWLDSSVTRADFTAIWQLVKTHFPPAEGYTYNTAYKAADWLIEAAGEGECSLVIEMNLLCYECVKQLLPKRANHLAMQRATLADARTIGQYIHQFQVEAIPQTATHLEACLDKARDYIVDEKFYVVKDDTGELLAMCSYSVADDLAKISHVYTPNEHRRQGYAGRLVYLVTKQILEQGLRAILYTDADYGASNACYRQIGYRQVGELCTIANRARHDGHGLTCI